MSDTRLQQLFIDGADLIYQLAPVLARPLSDAAMALLSCVTSGGRVLVAALPRSEGQGRQFVRDFIGPFERERPALAAVYLDGAAGDVSRQLTALGAPGDVLLVLAAESEGSAALLPVVDAAHDRDMTVFCLTGREPGALGSRMRDTDVLIAVPHARASRVRELHQMVLHGVCDEVDTQLLGQMESL
jgi:D-sedoheptulose 7-phosphate isomerase